MPLTVLSDDDIREILWKLSRDELIELQDNLSEALHDYSTGTQETTQTCSKNQPKRMALPAQDNRTTLFMPAVTNTSRGMKIISLPTAPRALSPRSSMQALNVGGPSRSGTTTSLNSNQSNGNSSFVSQSGSSISGAASTTATSNSSTSLDHTSSGNSTGSSDPTTISSIPNTTPYGSLTLLTPTGMPYAFIATEELTAFRTALAATVIFLKRDRVHSITVFGAGAQARWHIRLALMLRGSEIHHIDLVNRSFMRAKKIMHDFHNLPEWKELREANPKLQFSVISSDYKEYHSHLKELVRKADVIFMCTPATEPLFPHEYLTNPDGRRKGRYITCIGSYRPDMAELHPEILRQAVGLPLSSSTEAGSDQSSLASGGSGSTGGIGSNHHRHHHHPLHAHQRHASEGGVIVVDSIESCRREAGEVIQAGITPSQLVEMGELLMIKKEACREIAMGTGPGEKGLRNWIVKGNLVYKSVGLGVMDVCVGEDLVQIARQKGMGTQVPGF